MRRVITTTRAGCDAEEVNRIVVGAEAWQLLTELNETLFALAGVDGHVDRSVSRVFRREPRSP